MPLVDSGGGRNITQHNGGVVPAKVVLSGTVKTGDPIGYSSGFVRASNTIKCLFIAGQDGVSGDKITVYTEARIEGFSDGDIGDPVHTNATAGRWSETVVANYVYGTVVAADAIHVQARVNQS